MEKRGQKYIMAGVFYFFSFIFFSFISLNSLFASDVINLRVAAVSAGTNPTYHLIEWWGTELSNRTNGKVQIKIFGSESLAKAKAMLDAGKTGLADVIQCVTPYFPKEFICTTIPDLPFNSPPRADQYLAAYNTYAKTEYIQKELDEVNLVYLWANPAGQFNIMGKKPVRSINDLGGLKIRAVGHWSTLLQSFGAIPVFTTVTELYDAMSKGMVDALIGAGHYVMYTQKAHEAAKDGFYTIDMDMGRTGTIMYMNKDKYNSLPIDVKRAIDEIQVDVPRMAQKFAHSEELNQKYLKIFMDNGIKIIKFPREDRAKMIKKQDELTEKWLSEREGKELKVREAAAAWNKCKEEVVKRYPHGL